MARSGKFGSTLMYCLTRPLAILPLSFHRRCGRLIGRIACNLLNYRRDEVMINLARSFPDKKYDELRDIRRKFYAHFGKIFAEAMWFGARKPEALRKSGIARIVNVADINACYDKGRSVFVMGSHCGNWELFGGYRSYWEDEPFKFDETNMCVVYRRLSSPTWEDFMKRNRLTPIVDKKHYDGMVESFSLVRHVLGHRDRKMFYSAVADQFPYASSRLKVDDFMHQETWSMDGAPALAHKLGMAVFFLSMREMEDGHYEMKFIPICEDAREMSILEILNRYYALLAEELRAQPWNYLWTHRRWK